MRKKLLLESFEGIAENHFEVDAKIHSRSIVVYDPVNFVPRTSITLNLSFNSDALMDSFLLKGIVIKDKKGNYKTNKYGDFCLVNLNKKDIIDIISDDLANKIIKSAPDFIIEAKEQISYALSNKNEINSSFELKENFFNIVKEELLENVFEKSNTKDGNITKKLLKHIIFDDDNFNSISDVEKKNISKYICEELFFLYRNEIKNNCKISIYDISLTPAIYDTKNIFIQKRGILVRHKIIK